MSLHHDPLCAEAIRTRATLGEDRPQVSAMITDGVIKVLAEKPSAKWDTVIMAGQGLENQ